MGILRGNQDLKMCLEYRFRTLKSWHLRGGNQLPEGVGAWRRESRPRGMIGILRRETRAQEVSRGGSQELENKAVFKRESGPPKQGHLEERNWNSREKCEVGTSRRNQLLRQQGVMWRENGSASQNIHIYKGYGIGFHKRGGTYEYGSRSEEYASSS